MRSSIRYTCTILTTCALLQACSGASSPEDTAQNNQADQGQQQANNAKDNNSVVDMGQGEDQGGQQAADYSALVINEVAATGDPSDWFELYNSGDVALDLSGLGYSDDPMVTDKATFAQGTTLQPKTYLQVIVDDTTAGFKLGSDERIGVYTTTGQLIAEVDWEEGQSPAMKSFGRYPNHTGDFKTLALPTPGADNVDDMAATNDCGDGVIQAPEVCDVGAFAGQDCEQLGFGGGTLNCKADCSGFDTSACTPAIVGPSVVINELTSAGDDQIELYNRSAQAVELTGWYLADSGYDANDPVGTAAQRYDFEPGQTIAPHAFLVIPKTQDAGDRFGLGKEDAVLLFDDQDQVVDQLSYPNGAAETSYCRFPDGVGEPKSCVVATFGAANAE